MGNCLIISFITTLHLRSELMPFL